VPRPKVSAGVPFYLSDASLPGGRKIDAAAFSTPSSGQGNLGRNALRGFGATQLDLTLRRQFRFTERVSLQARADFFNIFNHPNFGKPVNYLSNTAQFEQATKMFAGYLGSGGRAEASIRCIRLADRAQSS